MFLIFNYRDIYEESILKFLFIKINFYEIILGFWMVYKVCSCKFMEKIIGDFIIELYLRLKF